MIKLVYCIHRHPGLTRSEFSRYWLNEHAALVERFATVLGAKKYVQSHTFDSDISKSHNAVRGSEFDEYDGVTEIWWENVASMNPEGVSTIELRNAAETLLRDETRFIDFKRSVIFLTEEHTIFQLQ